MKWLTRLALWVDKRRPESMFYYGLALGAGMFSAILGAWLMVVAMFLLAVVSALHEIVMSKMGVEA